jgi:hypothetical protein
MTTRLSINIEGALRAAFAGAIPLAVLVTLGLTEYAAFALFAGFVAIWGSREQYRHRVVTTSVVGALQILCMFAGLAVSVSGAPLWIEALGLVAVLVVGVGTLNALGSIPGQPIFPVFAFVVSALVPVRPADLPVAMTVIVASVAFACAVSLSGFVVRAVLAGRRPSWFRELAPSPRRTLAVLRTSALWETVALNVVGSLVAGAIALSVPGLGHPYWAVVAVVSTLPVLRQRHTMSRAMHRVIGTLGGTVIAVGVLLLHPTAWWIVVVAFLGQFLAELFVARNYALCLLFLTPLALSVSWLSVPVSPEALALDRIVQTAIGAAISIVLMLVGRAIEHRRGRALGATSSIRTV